MIEFTNADTGLKFLIQPELILSVTIDKDRNVFIWIDLEHNTGYKVCETYNSVRKLLCTFRSLNTRETKVTTVGILR